MIKNTNNIDKLIKSPLYAAQYNSWGHGTISYVLYNATAPHERIHVYKDKKYLDIYKFNNMNSEYFEQVSLGTKRGKQLHDILFSKHIAAMLEHIQTHFTDTPHR